MMAELAAQLDDGEPATVTGRAVASGDGGHGKTVLAWAYAHQFKERYPGGCFAVECESVSLVTALAALVLTDEGTDEQRARYAQAMLSQEPRCLLILDNVRDAEQWNDKPFRDYLPNPPCHIVVTTRAEHLPGTREVKVGKLTEDEAFALLKQFRPSAIEESNRAAVLAILQEVEYLAAAVAAIGAYMMLDEDDDWFAYAEHLQQTPLSELPDQSAQVRAETGYAGKTAQVLDDLRARLPEAEVRVLDYAALLPADQIVQLWLELLLKADAEQECLDLGCKPSGKPRTPADVIAHLRKLGLLTPSTEQEKLLSVHRLHRRRAAEILDQEPDQKVSRLDTVAALAVERGKVLHDALMQPNLHPELTPLAALVGELEAAGRFAAAVSLANWIEKPLRELGRYTEGRNLLEPKVLRCEAEPDLIAPDEYGALLNNLALILRALGELPAARRRIERAIEIDEKHFKPDHPLLATYNSNLAMILKDLGELPAARRWIERAIEIDEKHFEPDHPELAIYYNNLALILKDLGELPEARRRIEQAIEIGEKNFEPDHPTLAIRYSNLAMILKDLGELPAARRWIERAIEIDEKNFEPDHPTLATRYNNLALILQDLGDLPAARRRIERAIEIGEKHFKPEHPNMVIFRNNLDSIRRAEAERDSKLVFSFRFSGFRFVFQATGFTTETQRHRGTEAQRRCYNLATAHKLSFQTGHRHAR